MANPNSSLRPDGEKNNEFEDSLKVESNLLGLKHALHGASYQLKLGIVVCLANVQKSLEPANGFSFAVSAEDPTAGKFDDIVYNFEDGEKKGILKIQVKHKLGSPPPKITVKDFTTTSDTKNPFAILKYFTSFCDQQQSITDLEGFIICTNADINDKSKDMWKKVEPPATNDSTPSLDSYVSSLFDSIGGKYYQLDYDKLWAADGTFSNLYQLLRKCSKRARLAKLLVDALNPNKKITSYNSLLKNYRKAILDVTDRSEVSANDSYGFTKEFLDLFSNNSKPGYNAFRKEFENQYRLEFKIDGCVWDDLKQKRVYVSNDFLSDEKNPYSSSDSFPNDNVDESFKSFCEQLRLVCSTLGDHELDDAIPKIWRNLQYDDNHLVSDRLKEYNQENMAGERLFKTNFDWLMDPFAKPLHSDDIKKSLEIIESSLAYMKIEPISDEKRKEAVESPFRIRHEVLLTSDLYRQVETKSLHTVEAFDIPFGATVLLDTLEIQRRDHTTTMFLHDSDFITNADTVKAVFRCVGSLSCLIIICHEAFETVQNIVQNWEKEILKHPAKHIFIIRKTCNIAYDLSRFRFCDLTEDSWNQFVRKNIPFCTTTIFPSKLFQKKFLRKLPIEQVIKLLGWGKQMEETNFISKKYREIESTYVHRPWISQESNLKAKNVRWIKDDPILKVIKGPQQKVMSLNEITKTLKKDTYFDEIFRKVNYPEEEREEIVGDIGPKVLIFLGESGSGKSTNLTWLAWHLRKRYPSFWVVRCNLSDHCSDFKPFLQDQNIRTEKLVNRTEALRMLYKLIHSSVQQDQEIAKNFLKCLTFLKGQARVCNDLIKHHGLSLSNAIQVLVFKEKFNAGELVLLLDELDEIAPRYIEIVLQFLAHFEQFIGVRKLYITSRSYGFKELLKRKFSNPSFFQLKPLSLEHKGSMLYKMLKEKWHSGNNENEEKSDFYKSVCVMILASLYDMSDVPLNLMMAVDILWGHLYHHENISENISSNTFSRKLLETILQLSKPPFIVEEFVKVKIRHLFYDKNESAKNAADKPSEMERLDKAIDESKLLHGLVALRLFFHERDLAEILSDAEVCEAKGFVKEIAEGREKTGIIHGIKDGNPVFIHRSFAEYLAAWWIVKRRIQGEQQDSRMLSNIEFLCRHKELQKHIELILAMRLPLHLAIIERDWPVVESLLSTNPKSLYERDGGNRTALHLFASYYDFKHNWAHFLPNFIETDVINCKDKLFGWTALDYAFYRNNRGLIFYFLHHGASINVDVLYKQVTSASVMVREAAKYARYVMEYLSREVIACDSHNACKNMKKFCDQVLKYLASETSHTMFWERMFSRKTFSIKEKSILKTVVEEDSVWMLDSVIQRGALGIHIFRRIRNSYFDLALESNSILVVKYLMGEDSSILHNKQLWKCVVDAALKDYKIEFKYFFDLYCSRIRIKNFQPRSILSIQSDSIDCPIQNDISGYLIDYVEHNVKRLVSYFIKNICWAKLRIPTKVMIDESILSLLVMCVATGRPSMLRYLKKSCKLDLSAGIIYYLAMITNNLFSNYPHHAVKKPNKAYECLLDLASYISDVEANKMLRLAITSNFVEFSKCLIDRYNTDFQAIDELKGWNVFHLSASTQHSFWVKQMTSGDYDSSYVDDDKIDWFRYMHAKARDMDCFGIFDKKGRSIFHLAMENGQRGIVELILARKLGLNEFKDIICLSVDAIPNITFCCRQIYEISTSAEENKWHYRLLCMLGKQIAKISLSNLDEAQERMTRAKHTKLEGLRSHHLFLEEHAKELYQIAMKCRSLFLMYYLHREFPNAIPPPIYNADWLACTVDSLRSPNFLDFTNWMLNPNEVDQHVHLYEIVEKCDNEEYDLTSVNLETLINQVEENLSVNRPVEEVCKLKLLTLAVYLKQESMIRHLCETLKVNIDWKVLIDIVEIAHKSQIDEPGIKFRDGCPFETPCFDPIYRYLFERTSNLDEIDAEGRNVLHLAAQSGLGCMAMFLIKHNMVNVTLINELNGWNIFHYYASSRRWKCCYKENAMLLFCITKRVLEITSDVFTQSPLTESHKNKIKEHCFSSNEGIKSVIHVAVEAGNIGTIEYIIKRCLGIYSLDEHKIKNSDECSRFRQYYDELSQTAAQLPFNATFDYLLLSLAKTIQRFSPEDIEHIREQENVVDHIVEDAIRSSIMYRSVTTLEHLMIAYEDQVNQALVRSTNNELVACMTECIRRNRNNMFKMLVGHYRNLQAIQPRVEDEYDEEQNENEDNAKISEYEIQWQTINQFSHDISMNREYLPLLILSVAYGRVSLTRYWFEMLQLEVNKSLILLIMKVLQKLWGENCKTVTPVYEYLASRCEGKPNLLHLCIQAGCYNMLEYLIKEKNLDPNEVDSDNGWNAGHYCVSGPILTGYKEFTWLVESYKMDCFGVLDRNGRSILHLALDKGHSHAVKYIINHKLGLKGDNQLWYEWDLQKIDKYFKELQQILESVPENVPQQKQQVIQAILDKVGDRKIALTTYKQLLTNAS